jgi:hypothetical protein
MHADKGSMPVLAQGLDLAVCDGMSLRTRRDDRLVGSDASRTQSFGRSLVVIAIGGILLGLMILIAIGVWMSSQPTPASPLAPQSPRERGRRAGSRNPPCVVRRELRVDQAAKKGEGRS